MLFKTSRNHRVINIYFGSSFNAHLSILGKEPRYKLSMMGVLIDGPANIFGGNMNVVDGESIPESNPSEDQLGIFYHDVRGAYVDGIFKVVFVKVTHNITSCLNNILFVTANSKEV